MKKGLIKLLFFVLAIIAINMVRTSIQTNRKQDFIESMQLINGDLIGTVINKDSLQQDVCLLKIKLIKNEIGDLDLTRNGFWYITIKDNTAELAIMRSKKYKLGDSLLIDSQGRTVKSFRQGVELTEFTFDSLFIFRRTPVFFKAKNKRTLK